MWSKITTNADTVTNVQVSSINGNIKVDGKEIVVYDGGNKSDIGHKHTTTDITDFDTTNKTNGYVPQYDSSTEKLVLKPLPTGTGSGATSLDGLSDVDVTTFSPSEGSALKFEGGIWKPGTITASTQVNAEIPLNIEMWHGADQPMHPKVLFFNTSFGGFTYWMAYTPLNTEDFEDPSICASRDLIRWETPAGLTNPIDRQPPYEGMNSYFSDTHLVYNTDTLKLECWYRYAREGSTPYEEIYRKTTSDGVNWSARETLRVTDGLTKAYCPVVIYEGGKYKIWAGSGAFGSTIIKYYESTDGYNWQYIADVIGVNDWHFDFIRTDLGIEYVGGGSDRVNYATSTDGINFTGKRVILTKGDVGHFDSKQLYRPSLNKKNGIYYLFYTGYGENTRGIGLSISQKVNDITSLRGISAGSVIGMIKTPISGTTGQRPTNRTQTGCQYFDTQINKPIWKKNATQWVDANGTVV